MSELPNEFRSDCSEMNTSFDARLVQYTLTGDELHDNIVFVIVLQFAIYFVKDTLARLVMMQPRKWIIGVDSSNTLKYLAHARTALQDNFNRRIWHGFSGNVHPARVSRYLQRNRVQFCTGHFCGCRWIPIRCHGELRRSAGKQEYSA